MPKAEHRLIIFDKDGTICRNRHDPDGFINKLEEQEHIPGVIEICDRIRMKNKHLKYAVASNQGGVAFGHMERDEARFLVQDAAMHIGAAQWEVCYYHPDADHPYWGKNSYSRKPNPGMLLKLMVILETDPSETLFVGDRNEDYQAAQRAGCGFMWAHEFFGWEPPDNWKPPDPDHGEAHLGDE